MTSELSIYYSHHLNQKSGLMVLQLLPFLIQILEQISGPLGNFGEGADGWQLKKLLHCIAGFHST